jgi:hypothetical protein
MKTSRKLLIATVIGAAVVGVSAAFAAWSSTGSGSAGAQSSTSLNSVISAGSNSADLYPGAAKTVTVSISNPNGYPVVVNSISAGSSALVNGCAAGTVTSDARAIDAAGLLQSDGSTRTIAGNASATYTLDTHMAASATDACKSQTFALSLTATLTSNA